MKMCFFTISDKKIELTGGDGVLCVGMLEEMNYFESFCGVLSIITIRSRNNIYYTVPYGP